MLKIYISGVFILLSAILLNGIAAKLGITSWYDFLKLVIEKGKQAFDSVRLVDYCWLLLIYPFLLGASYKLGEYFYKLITG